MCDHKCKVGDNNGITCSDCGEVLEGFGYQHSATECLHVFFCLPWMPYCTCSWCDQLKPNPNYKEFTEEDLAANGFYD